jgi:hypothetical protein
MWTRRNKVNGFISLRRNLRFWSNLRNWSNLRSWGTIIKFWATFSKNYWRAKNSSTDLAIDINWNGRKFYRIWDAWRDKRCLGWFRINDPKWTRIKRLNNFKRCFVTFTSKLIINLSWRKNKFISFWTVIKIWSWGWSRRRKLKLELHE